MTIARRLALIAAAVTAMAACTNPVAPTSQPSQLTATAEAQMDGGYLGSAGRDPAP